MVAAGAVLAGVISGTTIAAGIGFSWAAFAGSLILGGLSYALTPKPKSSAPAQAQPGTVAVRQSDLTRSICYGATRTVRGYAHMESTNTNKDLHLMLMLCQGPVRDIPEIWVDDYSIPKDWINPTTGAVTQGRYAGYMTVKKHFGEVDQLADPLAIANMTDWSSTDRLQGIAYLYVIMNKNQDVYPTGVPNVTALIEGQSVYDPRIAVMTWTGNIALFARDYISSQYYGYGTANDDIDDVNVSAQANICDEIVAVTLVPYTAVGVDDTTNIIDLTSATYTVLDLQFGDQVQVTTTGTLPGGLALTTNYYVIPYQVLTNPRIMLATSLVNALAKTAIDLTTAGIGILTVSKVGEPRYHGAGVIDTAANLSDNLGNIVNCMAGRAIDIAGRWTLLAGAWRAPVVNFGIGDMRGQGLGFTNGLSISDSYNTVSGLFNGPATLYQDTDYPVASYPQFVADDGDIPASKELNLPFCSRATTAQRIAKIELFRGRQGIAFTSDYSMKAIQVQPGDVVGQDIDYLGWANKPFEITKLTFSVDENGLYCSTEQRETAQAIYDWSAGEAITYDPAPNSNLPDAFNVQTPSGVGFNSRITTTAQGDQFATLQLEWDLHPDAFVREYGQFELQAKLSSVADWSPGFKVSGDQTHTDIITASIGTHYDLRIRAINNVGVRSNWSEIDDAIVGNSGGVTVTDDWGSVAASPTLFKDWGSTGAAATVFIDMGFVF